MKVTNDNHDRRSERSHSQRNEDAKVNGIRKRMSDEEFYREIVEMKAQLNVLIELIQKNKEDHK